MPSTESEAQELARCLRTIAQAAVILAQRRPGPSNPIGNHLNSSVRYEPSTRLFSISTPNGGTQTSNTDQAMSVLVSAWKSELDELGQRDTARQKQVIDRIVGPLEFFSRGFLKEV
jgi:hypothetical protein